MVDDFERELSLESEMIGLGDSRAWADALRARDKGTESRTGYAQRIMVGSMAPFAEAVEGFIKDGEKRPGRKHSLIPILKQFDSPALVAFITLQSVLDSITKKKALTRTSVLVGRDLEDELRFKCFETNNKALWETMRKDLQRREPNLHRRRRILIHEMKKDAQNRKNMRWRSWSDAECLVIGGRCIELLETSTGLVRTYQKREGKKTIDMIEATSETLTWVEEYMDKAGVLAPMYLPTIIRPRRWTSPIGGGYHLQTVRPLRLVKVYGQRGNNYLEELANRRKQLRPMYDAINAVQATPWQINRPVLAVMQEVWKTGLEVGKVPMKVSREKAELEVKMPLPPKPSDIATNRETRVAWCRMASKIHTRRAQQVSRVLQQERLLWLAEKYQDEKAFYFPTQLDFRGRMYAVPSFLNPQGNDPAKSLLMFARGKKLGVSGVRWLKIHIANMYGEDKVSLDDREQWTDQNYYWISLAAASPLSERGWMKADKPWQFLAGAMELFSAIQDTGANPEQYFSHLPVTVDGTCNGLQHFSAMLLDEQGAEAVNLKPSEVPQDIYQKVADRVRVRLEREAKNGNEMAAQWLAWGFDRKATKRAVMIVPYSGTLFAAKEYTLDYIQERQGCPFDDDEFAAAFFFAQHVWAAIAEVIVSAKRVMNWLRLTARAVTANGVSIDWTTPVGFPVKQDYRDLEHYRVNTRIGDHIRYVPRLVCETGRFDRRAQEQGIAPNFVHSLDAACLMLTVNRAGDDGIDDFAMVHDSYGVLAADMDILYTGLRQAFVDIYLTDVLGEFFRSATFSLSAVDLAKIPVMPAKGTFVLESVKESKYFFA